MRIGVISDTHIPDRAEAIPEVVLQDLRSMDMVIHAGDLVELSVLETLRNVCKNVKAVYGNMDNYQIRQVLKEKEIFKVGNYSFGLIHGFGSPSSLLQNVSALFKDEKVDVVIFGHSHIPFKERLFNTLYFNPGSPTDKMFTKYNSYGILELSHSITARIVRID